jgi:spermidine synthase
MEYLFVVGFVSILGQVVLLRELNVAFFGVELIYTLALGIWLLFTGCGAMISRKSENPSFAKINSLLLLLSVAIPLDVVFIRSARLLASGIPGAYLPLQMQIAIVAASLLPIGLFLGLLFQWTSRVYISDRKSLASAYAIESVGGIAGGVCATLFLRFGFQNFLIALLCALAAAGSCFLHIDLKSRRWVQRIAAVTLAVLSLLIWKANPVDHLMTSWTHPNLAETRDTPYSRVTVTDQNGQVSVFENDALLFDTEGTRAEEFVQLAALQHPGPKRILILGGGIEGTVREALGHSPLRVDYVELNPMLIDVVPRHLPPYIRQSLQASNVRIIYDDPRRFLDHASRYDLIHIGMPEPAVLHKRVFPAVRLQAERPRRGGFQPAVFREFLDPAADTKDGQHLPRGSIGFSRCPGVAGKQQRCPCIQPRPRKKRRRCGAAACRAGHSNQAYLSRLSSIPVCQ